MSLKKALDKVKASVVDLTTLEVQTYSGTVDIINRNLINNRTTTEGEESTDQAGEHKSNSSTIRKVITEELNDDKKHLKLVAESVYQFDGDSYNFLTNDKSVDFLL